MSQQVGTITLAQRVGLNVFLLRQTRNPRMTQVDLAKKAGLAINTVVNLEANRDLAREPMTVRTDTIEAVAEALGVPALALFEDPFADDWPTRVYPNGLVQGSVLDLTKVPA